jgi:hypothetical protein
LPPPALPRLPYPLTSFPAWALRLFPRAYRADSWHPACRENMVPKCPAPPAPSICPGWAVTATKWHHRADPGRVAGRSMLSQRGPTRVPVPVLIPQDAAEMARARIGYSESGVPGCWQEGTSEELRAVPDRASDRIIASRLRALRSRQVVQPGSVHKSSKCDCRKPCEPSASSHPACGAMNEWQGHSARLSPART